MRYHNNDYYFMNEPEHIHTHMCLCADETMNKWKENEKTESQVNN